MSIDLLVDVIVLLHGCSRLQGVKISTGSKLVKSVRDAYTCNWFGLPNALLHVDRTSILLADVKSCRCTRAPPSLFACMWIESWCSLWTGASARRYGTSAIECPHVVGDSELKHAAAGSQVTTSGVDLEIPSGSPWISAHTPT